MLTQFQTDGSVNASLAFLAGLAFFYHYLKINFEVVCVECTQKKLETNRHADMHVLGDYCYISKGMVLNSHEDSDDEEFKRLI